MRWSLAGLIYPIQPYAPAIDLGRICNGFKTLLLPISMLPNPGLADGQAGVHVQKTHRQATNTINAIQSASLSLIFGLAGCVARAS